MFPFLFLGDGLNHCLLYNAMNLHPWDFPGKSTGVGCHFLLQRFRYDLNQIPHNYTMEVTNKFKVLDLVYRVPEKLWAEVHDILQEAEIKTKLQKKNFKRKNDCLRRPYK